ncbi:hypothetical protein KC19_N030600 [Ceratodon purpureus]|nr:hypothetical protein KC19_N030600 [Ceratodon purpureus]
MSGDADPSERTLEFSPTWALATVATVFVVISFLMERLLHWLGHFLTKTKRKALFAAFMKIKDELMLVGFISLAMALLATPVSKICIKSSLYDKWTPCHISERPGAKNVTEGHRRRLLGATEGVAGCPAGMEPFISANGLHQLHIFIFILAAVHVVYSCITMLLALMKVHSWRKWEREAQDAAHGVNLQDIANSITFTRKSTFQKYHTSACCSSNSFFVWLICFFQQIYIPRADYITLRQAFTTNHHLRDDYDFDAYMIRCMEDEFQKIVGISAILWAFVILFLLFNVNGVYLYFWSSFIPVILVLAIGAKLQYVVATLALEAADVPGAFVSQMLKPRNELFWFGRPELVLSILHLVLFQNAFELATFFWYLWTFGWHSCLLESNKSMIYARLSVGLAVQLFCSVSTLPLYTLVSQMGTNYKQAVLPPSVGKALHTWHKDAKKRVKIGALFSFRNKRDRSTLEEQSLQPKDSGSDSSLSPPMGVIMEESTLDREDMGQPPARTPGTPRTTRTPLSVYVQIDANEKDNAGRKV